MSTSCSSCHGNQADDSPSAELSGDLFVLQQIAGQWLVSSCTWHATAKYLRQASRSRWILNSRWVLATTQSRSRPGRLQNSGLSSGWGVSEAVETAPSLVRYGHSVRLRVDHRSTCW